MNTNAEPATRFSILIKHLEGTERFTELRTVTHRRLKNFKNFNQSNDSPVIEVKYDGVQWEINRVGSWYSDKEHKCSICFKVFASGQTLGGHKILLMHDIEVPVFDMHKILLICEAKLVISGLCLLFIK